MKALKSFVPRQTTLYMQCFSLTSQSAVLACVVLLHARQRGPLAPANAARSEAMPFSLYINRF